ncbi:MAG: hypothetical protein AAGD14_19705, partial [Planctomycetota bacterium]
QPIESRQTWDWGLGKSNLRARIYIRQGEQEVLQYESVVFWNPRKKRVESITFSLQGPVTRGHGAIQGRTLRLEQPASGSFPAMRSLYVPDGQHAGRYVGRNYFRQGDDWKLVMEAAQTRAARKARPPAPTKAKTARTLAPLQALVGSWRAPEEAPMLTITSSLHV